MAIPTMRISYSILSKGFISFQSNREGNHLRRYSEYLETLSTDEANRKLQQFLLP